jgi:hypothetical protein
MSLRTLTKEDFDNKKNHLSELSQLSPTMIDNHLPHCSPLRSPLHPQYNGKF